MPEKILYETLLSVSIRILRTVIIIFNKSSTHKFLLCNTHDLTYLDIYILKNEELHKRKPLVYPVVYFHFVQLR